jgi:hypothetical protein
MVPKTVLETVGGSMHGAWQNVKRQARKPPGGGPRVERGHRLLELTLTPMRVPGLRTLPALVTRPITRPRRTLDRRLTTLASQFALRSLRLAKFSVTPRRTLGTTHFGSSSELWLNTIGWSCGVGALAGGASAFVTSPTVNVRLTVAGLVTSSASSSTSRWTVASTPS